jgi:hypothetical protein
MPSGKRAILNVSLEIPVLVDGTSLNLEESPPTPMEASESLPD